MIFDNIRKETENKYGPASRLKPLIEDILKKNPEGLTSIRIKRILFKSSSRFIKSKDVSTALQSKHFQTEREKGKETVYRIKPS